jgi:hypothetical protein
MSKAKGTCYKEFLKQHFVQEDAWGFSCHILTAEQVNNEPAISQNKVQNTSHSMGHHIAKLLTQNPQFF